MKKYRLAFYILYAKEELAGKKDIILEDTDIPLSMETMNMDDKGDKVEKVLAFLQVIKS